MKIKKYLRHIVCLLSLLAILTAGITMPSAAENSDATVQSYEQKMAELEEQKNAALAGIESTEGDISNSIEQKQYLDQSISATYGKMQVAQAMIDELDGKIETKNAEIAAMEKKIEERWQTYKDRMVVIADDGNLSYLEMLLDAGSLDSFFSNYDAIASIVEYDHQVMKEYKDTVESLNRSKEELAVAQETQEATIATLEQDEKYLEEASAQVDGLLGELKKQKEEYEQNYAYYKAEEERISAELQEYMRQQATQNPVYIGGAYIWPLNGYTNVSSGFGNRVLYGVADFHRGLDIPADAGTPIMACNGGTVVRSEYHYSWGNYVLIDHGNGQSTLYAHMTSTAVSAGATVSQGDVIGYVGQTGNAYGNHLHLEYWINGNITDPYAMFG